MQVSLRASILGYRNYCPKTSKPSKDIRVFPKQVAQSSGNEACKSTVPSKTQNMTPQQILESMRNSDISKRISTVINGVIWNDEKFASMVGHGEDISTGQFINWEATGKEQLTEEQILQLQEKYDIENMSRQDYYNLMSDLTQMNVISAQDCVRTQFKTWNGISFEPDKIGGSYYCNKFSGSVSGSFSGGNILHSMKTEYEYSKELLNWLNTKEFNLANPMESDEKEKTNRIMFDDANSYERLYQIYQSLKK